MPYTIFVSLQAEADILVAYEWYEQQKNRLGEELLMLFNFRLSQYNLILNFTAFLE
jgi:hypothetical protein